MPGHLGLREIRIAYRIIDERVVREMMQTNGSR